MSSDINKVEEWMNEVRTIITESNTILTTKNMLGIISVEDKCEAGVWLDNDLQVMWSKLNGLGVKIASGTLKMSGFIEGLVKVDFTDTNLTFHTSEGR